MMAAEVNQTYFAWSQGESTELDGSQGVSVSQTLDHGSISFGRFELESLSWEKWSVFTNDRRHEEFGKFNGLVAEKKAYFEEYYKRIRELKAAQQQLQQTELILEYSGDGSDSSQTGEYMQAAELESPTGSGIVDDYVEQTVHETTSEQGFPCYDNHEDENFITEFPLSNLSSAGVLQQTNQDVSRDDNSTDSMDTVQQNTSSCHVLGTSYEDVRIPKRIIEKDPRLRYASKIIPKSVQTFSDSPLDRISASKRPGSVKSGMSAIQKTKHDNDTLLRRPTSASQKMSRAADGNKLTAKETLGVTGVRRPSSASAQRPSAGERRPITRESAKKHADVSTQRRPSTAERQAATRERVRKQTDVSTPRRPSTSERRPANREIAAKHADIATIHRPSTGERRPITRESGLKRDMGMPSKTRAAATHPKGATTTIGIVKKAVIPNASSGSKLETKSNVRGPKGPSTVGRHSTMSKSMDLLVAGRQKSSSLNLPPKKKLSSSIAEPAPQTVARLKKKEGIQTSVQSRPSISKRTTLSQTGKVHARTSNPPPPPPPPRRPSRTINKPNASNSSIVERIPKISAPKWH